MTGAKQLQFQIAALEERSNQVLKKSEEAVRDADKKEKKSRHALWRHEEWREVVDTSTATQPKTSFPFSSAASSAHTTTSAKRNLAGRGNGVNLKNILGQIEADRANIHGGWLLCSGLHDSNPSWHLNAVSGSHPPHPLWVKIFDKLPFVQPINKRPVAMAGICCLYDRNVVNPERQL